MLFQNVIFVLVQSIRLFPPSCQVMKHLKAFHNTSDTFPAGTIEVKIILNSSRHDQTPFTTPSHAA